jgi:hypothetical protein
LPLDVKLHRQEAKAAKEKKSLAAKDANPGGKVNSLTAKEIRIRKSRTNP